MDKKVHRRTKGKRAVASLLLAATMLTAVAPAVHAEEGQTSVINVAAVQSSTKETVKPDITRYEGGNREEVAINVAENHFSDSNKVILVNRNKFPDAISATNISQGEYPVLYTNEDFVKESTLEFLESMPLDEIFILGGEESVHNSVVEQLEEATNVNVTRIDGRNRYVANVNAVEENFTQANHVVIASGAVFADALYGVSYANTLNSPVLLTRTNGLALETVELLNDLNVEKVTIVGGPVTVTEDVEKQLTDLGIEYNRISGRTRYVGSAEVAEESYTNPENVVVASGEVFSDALVSAPIAQKLDAPILLVRNNRMVEEVEDYLTDNQVSIENIYIQGGPLTIDPAVERRIETLTTYERSTNIVPETRISERFTTVEVEDDTLPEGETEVEQEGEHGYSTIYLEVTYIDGVEVSRVEVDREYTDPVDRIIRVGTQVTEVKEETVTESVEFETEEVLDFNATVGEREVRVDGQDGERENTYAVTYVNGVETDRELIDSTVTVEPVNEVVAVGVLPETPTEAVTAPNGMTIVIDNISYTEDDTNNVATLTVEYTETNDTDNRVEQNVFKLYTDGEDEVQDGDTNVFLPGDSASGTATFRFLKSETPQTLEYGNVSLNTQIDPENPVWTFVE